MDTFSLDYPFLSSKSDNNKWEWTVRNAVEGVQIFGGIGSGKTSGSGRTLALKYLKAQFGGLVLTVKPDEKDEWVKYCQITGREKDLIIIEPNGKHSFNFLEFESRDSKGGQAITDNIVEVLKTVIRASEAADKGKTNDAFWETALDMLIYNLVDLCQLANGKVRVEDMYRIAQSLPIKKIDSSRLTAEQKKELEEKIRSNPFHKAKSRARDNILNHIKKLEADIREKTANPVYKMPLKEKNDLPLVRTFASVDEFFGETFRNLSEKTRSIIDFSLSGFLFRLMREPVYSLFCDKPSTVTPLDCMDGKIILINLPVKIYHKAGRDCQILFKYIWQRAMEQRRVNEKSRPVFQFADEAQNFIHEHDAAHQATARSSKIATLYITQNLHNYYSFMGGDKPEHKVKSFLGTLATKIFHANADIETNNYASNLIGDVYRKVTSKGKSISTDNFSQSESMEVKLERAKRPEEFISLSTGGVRNNFRVGCIIHRQGDPFIEDRNYKFLEFNQNYMRKINQ